MVKNWLRSSYLIQMFISYPDHNSEFTNFDILHTHVATWFIGYQENNLENQHSCVASSDYLCHI